MDEPQQSAGDAKTAADNTSNDAKKEQAAASETTKDAEKSMAEQLADAKADAAKNLDGWQRAMAEFANYRKRIDKERAETYQVASIDTLRKFLPVIDDFDRAVQSIPPDQANGLAYEGLKIIHRKLLSMLEATQIKVVNPLNEKFDPALHEAIGEDEGTGVASGMVTAVLQKGYIYGDNKILRAAMVRVSA